MFGGLVWVMILVGTTSYTYVGSFKSKEACVEATKNAIGASNGDVYPNASPYFYCIPVENPPQK